MGSRLTPAQVDCFHNSHEGNTPNSTSESWVGAGEWTRSNFPVAGSHGEQWERAVPGQRLQSGSNQGTSSTIRDRIFTGSLSQEYSTTALMCFPLFCCPNLEFLFRYPIPTRPLQMGRANNLSSVYRWSDY